MMSFIVKTCFLLYLCKIISTTITEKCQTPENLQGLCKTLPECPMLYKTLQEQPLSQSTLLFLKQSQCGFLGTTPKVCCLNSEVNFTSHNSKISGILQHTLLPDPDICGVYVSSRIFGHGAEIGEFPWNALLEYKTRSGRKEFNCGGVLISDRYVLTAAHCVTSKNNQQGTELMRVYLGEHNTETNPDCEIYFKYNYCGVDVVGMLIEEVIIHEGYNSDESNHNHDIALIRLQSKVSFNDFIAPICLPSQNPTRNYGGVNLEATGWGVQGGILKTTTKKRISGTIKHSAACQATLRVTLGQNQMCVGNDKSLKICSYDDSGGVLVDVDRTSFNWYAAGVMAFGVCNDEDHLRIYTRVDRYVDWILNKLSP